MKKLRIQLFIIVYSGLAILVAFHIYGQYRNNLELSERLVLERLEAISNTLRLQLDPEKLLDLQKNFPVSEAKIDTNQLVRDPVYADLTSVLKNGFRSNRLKTPIYTLMLDTVTGELRLGISSHGAATYGLHYNSHVKEHLEVYGTGGTIAPYTDEYGTWLSALVPLRLSDGRQVAALEVDYPFDDFLMYANEDLQQNMALAFLVFVGVGFFLFLTMRRMLKADEMRQLELKRVNSEMKDKKESLESSIRYAARIQAGLQPSDTELSDFFSDHMVLDLPRDTVSGDFYWFHRMNDDQALLAVADCTGHGVPGALLSIMGYDLLNEAVNVHRYTLPQQILEHLDKRIHRAFAIDGEATSSDGMDVGICLVDRKKSRLVYAGARRPLTIVGPDGTSTIQAAKRSIGQNLPEKIRPMFIDEELRLDKHSRCFLYSDGLQDQFGGERSKKIGHARLRQWFGLLNEHLRSTGKDQLTQLLNEWRRDEEQVDDICLVGFSI